jgi:DNA-binding response OmpR family regulator
MVARRLKILVVDDNVSLAENVAEILAQAGHHADVAPSAEEALRRMEAGTYLMHALLTDYRLPGASGTELIGSVRRLGYTAPALMMTGYRDDKLAAAAIEAGASDVVPKPVDIGRLLAWVETLRGR